MQSKKTVVSEIFKKKYSGKCPHLCRDTIISFANETLEIIFPQRGKKHYESEADLEVAFEEVINKLRFILSCIHKELDTPEKSHKGIVTSFESEILALDKSLSMDADFIMNEDPACKSLNEVIICYPGFFAISIYRLANFFYQQKVPLLPRILAEYAHEKTGIDIHPGASIQAPFFIDHGTGIVIGETAEIGKNCKIFQGVTLGALSVKRKYQNVKRHPTIGDNCLIYSNATILGGETIIGSNTVIGGNVWITESIAKNAQVYRKHGYEIEIKKD